MGFLSGFSKVRFVENYGQSVKKSIILLQATFIRNIYIPPGRGGVIIFSVYKGRHSLTMWTSQGVGGRLPNVHIPKYKFYSVKWSTK